MPRRRRTREEAWFLWGSYALIAALMSACAAARHCRQTSAGSGHAAGERFLAFRMHHGIPILQKSFVWDGNGEVDNTGLGVHAGTYVRDAVAVGGGVNLASWWMSGRDVYSAELEGLLRVHPVTTWPVFVDGTGGYQIANDQIPPGGTVWNFAFALGAGVELPLRAGSSLQTACYYHHISNALGHDNDRNPSQNEARLWIGVTWTF